MGENVAKETPEVTTETQEDSEGRLTALLMGLGVGLLLGTALAVFFAPQSGRDTREDLGEWAGRARTRTEESLQHLKQSLEDLANRFRTFAEAVQSRLEEAIEAGKQAAEQKRQELEKRVKDISATGESPKEEQG
jgi:gas vesicle protein